jgi:hypothetical protein
MEKTSINSSIIGRMGDTVHKGTVLQKNSITYNGELNEELHYIQLYDLEKIMRV